MWMRPNIFRVALLALSLCALAPTTLLAGCGGPDVRAPNPTRALDERRAIEVIRRAVGLVEGGRPVPGRDVDLVNGRTIRIDVGIEGHEYGIAYVTDEDSQALGTAIPPPNKQDEKLRIMRAGPDGEVRVVLLYQNNYRYDDLVGESHEQTTITAERELTRDVQDFVTYARTQKFK
jgi:hypothetical protein